MMHFYSSPGSCGIGIRVLLEEVGARFEAHALNFAAKEQMDAPYRAVNPKGKVPALVRDDGSLLTEFQAIAFWLADAFPDAALVPSDPEGRLRVMEIMDYMVGSVHMRGFTFVIVPGKFTPTPAFQEELVTHGKAQIAIGFATLVDVLGDKDYLMGAFGIPDAALFYMTRWAVEKGVNLPPSLAAHHNRMLSRPAVLRALEGEGIAVRRAA
ncbi:glutathione S-transferase family protein [Tropicibacter sp. S64]|uniref:glutathione S-transferase family protein n=1 Tax=Tropicibacter sp. S64 TaxID=3415122 RepID=UPI003C79AA14